MKHRLLYLVVNVTKNPWVIPRGFVTSLPDRPILPVFYVLPARFDKVSYTGCAVLPWQGKPVSMVCFNSGKTSATKHPDLFLFVINRADVPRAPKSAKPQFAKLGALTVASWTKGDKTYLLAGAEDEASLRDYF